MVVSQMHPASDPNAMFKTTAVMPLLGSLQVYTVEKQINGFTQIGAKENGIYWCDAGSPQGYGPFNSIYQAMEHYRWVIGTDKGHKMKPQISPDINNLIRVDFKNKKRVVE